MKCLSSEIDVGDYFSLYPILELTLNVFNPRSLGRPEGLG